MTEFIYSLEMINGTFTPVRKEKIIRCEDCKYVDINYPDGMIFCRMIEKDRKSDDYCSRGKRRG